MGLLDTIIESTSPMPPKLIVSGEAGIGKTTLARSANAILIDCENGAGNIPGLKRTPYLSTWPDMRKWLVEFAQLPAGQGPATLAIDTIDWMLTRIIEHVTIDMDSKAKGSILNTIGSSHGGYFKARDIVQNIVSLDLLPMLNAINNNGTAILILAHAANLKMKTPEGYDLQTASPDIPEWLLPMFTEWADAVLYAHMSGGNRVFQTEKTNVVLAKNRYGMPAELPMTWTSIKEYAYLPDDEPAVQPKPETAEAQAA